MRKRGEGFRRKADGVAAEINELEHFLEQYGAPDQDEPGDVAARLEWLRESFEHYMRPPTWPFDVGVSRRLAGTLGTMAASLVLSEVFSAVTKSLLS